MKYTYESIKIEQVLTCARFRTNKVTMSRSIFIRKLFCVSKCRKTQIFVNEYGYIFLREKFRLTNEYI